MENGTVRQRQKPLGTKVSQVVKDVTTGHPGGEIKHGTSAQIARLLLIVTYFVSSCASIVVTQFIGAPLYWINRDLYYAYMALTKQSFALFITTLTHWFAPTKIRVSGDASVAGQIHVNDEGLLKLKFPERMIMIANHQIYSDWLYLWWTAYANSPGMHGHIYIILRDNLKYIPIIGWGMMFYGFIFMSRKMATDQPRMAHRLGKLKQVHSGPLSGKPGLDPMWLMLFPEGTNLSGNTRKRSTAWAEKINVKDFEHVLLPRATGTFFCLNELKGTVDYIYDCTMAYEGVPRGEYGQDIFTLRSIYLRGQAPPSVNMYWRRFAIKDIPLANVEEFDAWLQKRWAEKEAFMEEYLTTGRFPANAAETGGIAFTGERKAAYIETEVKLNKWYEIGKMFTVLAILALLSNIGAKAWNRVVHGKQA